MHAPLPAALDLVKRFEGCRLKSYQDQAGVWTVGYGCTGKDIGAGVVWTQEQADAEVARRVGDTQHVLEAMLDVPVTDRQKAALVSLTYNIGLHAFETSTVLRMVNASNFPAAADAFRMWNKAGGKVNTGLVNRREAERAIFLA